jgi:hypothetical protein
MPGLGVAIMTVFSAASESQDFHVFGLVGKARISMRDNDTKMRARQAAGEVISSGVRAPAMRWYSSRT